MININYSDSRITSKNETFTGDYDGVGFQIDAHWNDWDDWEVDSIEFDSDLPEDFNQEEAIKEITEEFLDNMY